MKRILAIAAFCIPATTALAHSEPIDDAAPYIYERCLESLTNPAGLAGEMAGTRFTLQPYPAGGVVGATEAYAHPLLGETRAWGSLLDNGDRVQVGCTMVIDGGHPDGQFDRIEEELADAIGERGAASARGGFGSYAALDGTGKRFSQKVGDMTLSHVLTKGIPGDPSRGYIMSLFLDRPK